MDLSELKIPSARQRDQRPRGGRIIQSRVLSLLIGALNEKLNGWTHLQLIHGARVKVFFQEGCVSCVESPEIEEIYWSLLAKHLPEEQLVFARQHSQSRALGALATLKHLVLLPPLQLQGVQREAVTLEMSRLCQCEENDRIELPCRVDPPEAIRSECGLLIEPLGLISECLLHSVDLDAIAKWLAGSFDQLLSCTGRLTASGYESSDSVKKVAALVRHQPESYRSLLRLGQMSGDQLVSVLGTLLATGSFCPLDLVESSKPRRLSSSHVAPRSIRGTTSRSENRPSTLHSSVRNTSIPSAAPAVRPSSSSSLKDLPTTATPQDRQRAAASSGVRRVEVEAQRPSTPSFVPTSRKNAPSFQPSAPPQSSAPAFEPSAPSQPSAPPSQGLGAPQHEAAAEANAFKAWMAAESEPQCLPRALTFAKKAARHYPGNPAILFYLGSLHMLSGNYLDAEVTLGRVLELDPEHMEAARELRRVKISVSMGEDPSSQGRFGGG